MKKGHYCGAGFLNFRFSVILPNKMPSRPSASFITSARAAQPFLSITFRISAFPLALDSLNFAGVDTIAS